MTRYLVLSTYREFASSSCRYIHQLFVCVVTSSFSENIPHRKSIVWLMTALNGTWYFFVYSQREIRSRIERSHPSRSSEENIMQYRDYFKRREIVSTKIKQHGENDRRRNEQHTSCTPRKPARRRTALLSLYCCRLIEFSSINWQLRCSALSERVQSLSSPNTPIFRIHVPLHAY